MLYNTFGMLYIGNIGYTNIEIPLWLCCFYIVFARIICLPYENFWDLVKIILSQYTYMPVQQISQVFVVYFISEAVCVPVLTSARSISLCLCGNHFFNAASAVIVKNIIEVSSCDLKLGSEKVVGLD